MFIYVYIRISKFQSANVIILSKLNNVYFALLGI